MKKFIIALLCIVFAAGCLCFSSCVNGDESNITSDSQNNGQTTDSPTQTQPQPNYGSVLIVYFSYSGTTERVANELPEQLSASAVELVPETAYTSADVNYNNASSRNRRELAEDLRPAISDSTYSEINIDDCQTVIIGYPIWNGYEPMIIRTFIERYNGLQGKTVYTFSTSASSSGSTAHKSIFSRCPNADVKDNLHFTSSTLSDMSARVSDWIERNDLKKITTMQNNILYLTIGNTTLSATLVDNESTRALKQLLSVSPLTIEMDDYANFEKVGDLGVTLPRCDEHITTQACDLILYLGSRFVIYYDTNAWDFTRLGKIDNVTQSELKQILGGGSVTVTLSLTK